MENSTVLVENIIRSYPELQVKMSSLRAACKGQDPTAAAATVELPPDEQRHYNAIVNAIHHTKAYDDGARRLLFLYASYWGKVENQELLQGISWLTAQEYRADFIQIVSQKLDLHGCAGCMYWKPLLSSRVIYGCHYCYETRMMRTYDEQGCYSKRLVDRGDED